MDIRQERLIQTFQQLVSIDSPSRHERRMADTLIPMLRDAGLTVTEDDAGARIGGDCGNLLATWPSDDGLPPLLFCAHMDTVAPALGKRAVLDPDGTIHSAKDTVLGADDLSAVAAILEAVRVIHESGTRHRSVELLFSVSEEAYCAGVTAFDVSRIRSREAYILDYEGAPGTAAIAAPTILLFRAEISGKAAHAGFAPEAGINAIAAAARAVDRLRPGRISPDLTLNIGRIQGGLLTNIVPERCVVEGEIRASDHSAALAEQMLVEDTIASACAEFGATLQFTSRCPSVAYSTPADSPVVKRYFDVCRARSLQPKAVRTFGGSDNNILSQHGISGIVIASAMHACHSCGEYTTVGELVQLAGIVTDLMTSAKDY